MSLQEEIDTKRANIRMTTHNMSIGELISLYEHKDLNIHPEFRPFLQWDIWQKSRFIESILLGIPIPTISIFQKESATWSVLDGFQELSTIFQFIGILRKEDGTLEPPLVLEGTENLPSLKGTIWIDDDEPWEPEEIPSYETAPIEGKYSQLKPLTSAQRFLFRLAKTHVDIILKEGDEAESEGELLQRKANLPDQALRNCILLTLNRQRYEWIKQLAHDENFMQCTNLSDQSTYQLYDQELVLRFLALRTLDDATLQNMGDFQSFLLKRMRELAIAPDFQQEKESKTWSKTFELLASTVGENSFRTYNPVEEEFEGGFSTPAFESIALGIGYHLDHLSKKRVKVREKVEQLWQMPEFLSNEELAINDPRRIAAAVSLGRELFRP